MARFPGASLAASALLLVTISSSGGAQGGWRQWDIGLRNGTRVVANPLGAPDCEHLSLSVAGFDDRAEAVSLSQVDFIAAHAFMLEHSAGRHGAAALTKRVHVDVVVLLNGRRTNGHVTLSNIRWSAGSISQHGREIRLDSVAYIRFAPVRPPQRARCRTIATNYLLQALSLTPSAWCSDCTTR